MVRTSIVLLLVAGCESPTSGSAPDAMGNDADHGGSSDAPTSTCGTQPDLVGPMAMIDLSVPGRVFEMDLGASEYGRRVTPGNGCEVTSEATIGFGGAHGARVVPPDVNVGGNSEYCGFASGAPLSRGGVEVGSLNIRYAMFVGRGFAAATATGGGPKAIIPYVVDAQGTEGFSSRPMVFWGGGVEHDGTNYGAIGVTEGTVQSYQEPEDQYWPEGPGRDAIYFGPAANHAGTATAGTPVVGDEWIIVEHEWDLRRDRGNANGLNRLYVWTRDGVVSGAVLDIPLTWDGNHEWEGDRFSSLDGIGYYWNLPADRTADDHLIYSHVAFAANRPTGQPIGPPPGFLESCQ